MQRYIELLVSVGFLGAMMWGMLKFMLRDIHKDLTGIRSEIHDLKSDMREGRIRTDHLYQICIDLLKEKK